MKLADIVGRLTSGPPLCVRVLESGTVRTEMFAEDAMRIAALLLPVTGRSAQNSGALKVEPVTVPRGEIDIPSMHPTWYAMQAGVDYKPGLSTAFAARAALRYVLCACLPRAPLAVLPTANVAGRGVVRLDLTPANAERLAVLLERVGDLVERGQQRCRS